MKVSTRAASTLGQKWLSRHRVASRAVLISCPAYAPFRTECSVKCSASATTTSKSHRDADCPARLACHPVGAMARGEKLPMEAACLREVDDEPDGTDCRCCRAHWADQGRCRQGCRGTGRHDHRHAQAGRR